MNHCVPCFEMEDEMGIPPSSSSSSSAIGRNAINKGQDDFMELMWQEGQVIEKSTTQRFLHKSLTTTTTTPEFLPPPRPPPQTAAPAENNTHLHIAEDEMAAWLHYPFEDLSDLLNPNPNTPQNPQHQPSTAATRTPAIQRPPPHIPPRSRPTAPKNFPIFSRLGGLNKSSSSSTVVESNVTPAPATATPTVAPSSEMAAEGREGMLSWSTSGSGSAGGGGRVRKRKEREKEEDAAVRTECHTEDVELEYDDEKRHPRGSSAAKRTRAAEVHNLSERKRRDRINEKMKALQELVPRCNKSDKASMLDEAIEYLKSLQMQVQMMSVGCGSVPMMYPGIQQQYMPPMGIGMGMGMGMEMGMGMNRPVMPFPSAVPAGSVLPTTPAGLVLSTPTGTVLQANPAALSSPNLAPKIPVPIFPMPPSNQADSVVHGSFPHPNNADPYQQYIAFQQMQMQMQTQMQMQMQMQGQSNAQPGSSKPSTSKDEEEHNRCG